MKKKIIGILKDNIDNPEKSEAEMIKKMFGFTGINRTSLYICIKINWDESF